MDLKENLLWFAETFADLEGLVDYANPDYVKEIESVRVWDRNGRELDPMFEERLKEALDNVGAPEAPNVTAKDVEHLMMPNEIVVTAQGYRLIVNTKTLNFLVCQPDGTTVNPWSVRA